MTFFRIARTYTVGGKVVEKAVSPLMECTALPRIGETLAGIPSEPHQCVTGVEHLLRGVGDQHGQLDKTEAYVEVRTEVSSPQDAEHAVDELERAGWEVEPT